MCGQLILSPINVEIGIRFDCYTRMPILRDVKMVKDRISKHIRDETPILICTLEFLRITFL